MTITPLPILTDPSIGNQAIGDAVMAMTLDTAQASGQDMVKMMEQSVTPNLGKNVDVRV